MASRITIYDKSGQYLTEVNATFNREYKLNEFGSGTFTLSTADEKCRDDYLQFGNFVMVEHEKLPAWGGMIDTPQIWGNGQVTSTVYSAEYILTCLITDSVMPVSGTPGTIFSELVKRLFNRNKAGADYSIVGLGNVYGGGAAISRSYQWNGLYAEITRLCKDTGFDFDFEPQIDANGRLYFLANFYEKRGMLKPFTLYEDLNIELSSTPLRVQGRIANLILIFGPGANAWSRPRLSGNNDESWGKYGGRWLVQAAQGIDLTTEVNALLKEHAEPRKTFSLTAIDVGDTFYQLRVGDKFPVSFHSVGFSGSGFGTNETVRILQMKYDEGQNRLALVADQVKE